MRKRLTLALAAAVAVTVVVVGIAGAAQSPVLQGPNGNTQSIAVNITPQKVSKTTLTPATLHVKTATTRPSDPNGVPVPAVKAVVDFPKDLSIFSKGYPTCDDAVLQNTSTEVALQECKKAKIGVGSGTALLPVGTKVFPVITTITAFNGVPQGGKPVILLHTYSEKPVTTTIVLIGVVRPYDKQGFGPRLDVTIPLLAGGAGALTGFEVKVFKKFRYKGRLRSYISAICSAKKWKFRGEFVFRDGEALTPTATGKCSQSKK